MNYLVIDLEMCRVKKLYRKTYKYASEIIQIGAVLLDEGFNRIATMCEYVNPEYGVLDNFIESMTGIKNRDIKQAPKLTEALEHLTDWLGDREYKVYAWSDSDRTQILREIKAKNMLVDDDREEPNMFARISASMGIKMKTKSDNSDANIADMLIEGLTMGELEISKKIFVPFNSFASNI